MKNNHKDTKVYRVNIGETVPDNLGVYTDAPNVRSRTVTAKDAEDAIAKVARKGREYVESVDLIATLD